jgi:hypothetical protein
VPKCTDETVGFGKVGRRVVEAAFDGGDIVSDGGSLLRLYAVSCGTRQYISGRMAWS